MAKLKIVHPGLTRFAITFIALRSLHDYKKNLQALVTSSDYKKFLKLPKVKEVKQVILDERFWNNCLIIVRIMTPLIHLLHIYDSDEKSVLGYVYEGIYRVRKGIKKLFKGKKRSYKTYTNIINNHWDKMLRQSLCACAYWLNPTFQYDQNNFYRKSKIMSGLLNVIEIKAIGSIPRIVSSKRREKSNPPRHEPASIRKVLSNVWHEGPEELEDAMTTLQNHPLLFK